MMTGALCPSDEALLEFLDSELSPTEEIAILRHISSCHSCAKRVTEMRQALASIGVALDLVTEVSEEAEHDLRAIEAEVLSQLTSEGLVRERFRDGIRAKVLRVVGQTASGVSSGFVVVGRSLVRGAGTMARIVATASARRSSSETTRSPLNKAGRAVGGVAGKAVRSLAKSGLSRLGLAY